MCRFIEEFRTDMEALNCLPVSAEPKATDYVPAMVDTISAIMKAGTPMRQTAACGSPWRTSMATAACRAAPWCEPSLGTPCPLPKHASPGHRCANQHRTSCKRPCLIWCPHSSGGQSRRRAGEPEHGEAQPVRFCPVEGRETGRAHMGEPVGPRPTGVAHRVQLHDPRAHGARH